VGGASAQGFLPVLQLYLYHLSGGLVVTCDTNTSLSFVTGDSVAQFTEEESRYTGSSSEQKLMERSGPIA
jgi:simple sugar transport system substrate-binding protein